MKKPTGLRLRPIHAADCQAIPYAFSQQGWKKTQGLYESYLRDQEDGTRDVIIAQVDSEFAGYLTINWQANYQPFRERQIPEIVDFNVLKKYQRRGIGTALMDEAERRIKRVSSVAGIGVGVYKDYGPAQILYFHRGYQPDGNGLTLDSQPVLYGAEITVDDALVLALTKEL
jgi:GNAT superfamily N-acetyltransferase